MRYSEENETEAKKYKRELKIMEDKIKNSPAYSLLPLSEGKPLHEVVRNVLHSETIDGIDEEFYDLLRKYNAFYGEETNEIRECDGEKRKVKKIEKIREYNRE